MGSKILGLPREYTETYQMPCMCLPQPCVYGGSGCECGSDHSVHSSHQIEVKTVEKSVKEMHPLMQLST